MRLTPFLIGLLMAALCLGAAGGCKNKNKNKDKDKAPGVKDEWETGKYVPPPPPTKKLKALPRFTCRDVGKLRTWRYNPTLTHLSDGRVLVVGGRQRKGWLTSTEVINTGTWKSKMGKPMLKARALHSALKLADGRVLVVGGGARELELYDPRRNAWVMAGRLARDVVGTAAVQLPDGRVYLAGGESTDQRAYRSEAYTWLPKTGRLKALPRLKEGIRGQAFVASGGKIALLVKLLESSALTLRVTEPDKGTLAPLKAEGLLLKAVQAMARMPGGEQVVLAPGPDGPPATPPTGLKGKTLLRFFPSRLSWRLLARLGHDHSGGSVLALAPDRILVLGGSRADRSTIEVCAP